MSVQARDLTPTGREVHSVDLADILEATFGLVSAEPQPYSRKPWTQRQVAEARERDHDSRTRLVLWWKSIDGFDMDHFERYGRWFVRMLAMDALAELLGAPRGGVIDVKPDKELRRKVALFKRIQAAREDAFEFTGKGEYGGKDVPARLGLGGLQVFTPGA